MKQYFRIDLRFLVKTHVYQVETEPNNQYYIVAADEKEGLKNIVALIENVIALMSTMGYYGFRLERIYICTVDGKNEPVKELGYWCHGSPHLSEYDKDKLLAYFLEAIEVYASLNDKNPNPKAHLHYLFGSYNPAILQKIAKGMNLDPLMLKYEVKQLMQASLPPGLQPCRRLFMLVYYTQLQPEEAVRVTKENVVNHCLVLTATDGAAKIIPLHPRLENMLLQEWDPEQYTGAAIEEHTCFDKIMELAKLKKDVYPSAGDISNSSFINMLITGFLREDILLLRGEGLNGPDEYRNYEKILERLFNSSYYYFPDGPLA